MIACSEQLMGLPEGSTEARAALARDLEAQLMSLPTGRQDHFPALLGGALKIEHRPGGERVSRIVTDLGPLAESLVVVYSGQSHFSAGMNWEVVRRRLDGDLQTIDSFKGIAEVAHRLGEALEQGDLERVGLLMSREFELRRGLAPGVSTLRVESLLGAAREAGAWGGKVCGAGGGGCLAILAPPEARPGLERALAAQHAEILSARPVTSPMEVSVS
jgi:D-glycero-alpha-D-manno-heptose-7-phosphate kinase